MRDRKFGVEIECGYAPKNSKDFNVNTDSETDHARGVLCAAAKRGDINRYWGDNIGNDGTLIEVRSPILRGYAGFQELRTVMELLSKNGGYVTTADGMHVHHDAPEFVDDIDAVIRLVKSWHANRRMIGRFVRRGRRTSGACPAWRPNDIANLETFRDPDGKIAKATANLDSENQREYLKRQGIIGYDHRGDPVYEDFKRRHWDRRDLNISALGEHGTVEIRLAEGMLDPVRAEAWVRFGQAFLNKVASMTEPLPEISTDREEFLRRIRAPKFTLENLELQAI